MMSRTGLRILAGVMIVGAGITWVFSLPDNDAQAQMMLIRVIVLLLMVILYAVVFGRKAA